jgi:hypothetical protein
MRTSASASTSRSRFIVTTVPLVRRRSTVEGYYHGSSPLQPKTLVLSRIGHTPGSSHWGTPWRWCPPPGR